MSQDDDHRPGGARMALMLYLATACTVFAAMSPCLTSARAACPNEALRTGPSAGLPDCRAYEKVTPSYKDGYEVIVEGNSADGSAVIGQSLGAFAGAEDSLLAIAGGRADSFGATYRFTRDAVSGWQTTALELPASGYPVSVRLDASPSLGSTLWFGAAQPPVGYLEGAVLGDLVVRAPDGAVEEIGPIYPPSTTPSEITGQADFGYGGASADLSHVVFTLIKAHHWPGDSTTGEESLYEYVDRCGEPAACETAAPILVGLDNGGNLVSSCGTQLGYGYQSEINGPRGHARRENAISESGATVFFTALACGGAPPVDELLARIERAPGEYETVSISEPSRQDCSSCNTSAVALAPARFEAASRDGSKVFFTTTQPLLSRDTSVNLYEYDFSNPEASPEEPAGRLIRVSRGGSLAGVQGIVGVSQDGSHVYFVATGALTKEPNTFTQVPQKGADNLYLFERDAQYPAGHIAFVTALSEANAWLWGGRFGSVEVEPEVSVTASGPFLVFTSPDRLTPDDSSAPQAPQVFEYDAQTGALTRVSIGQAGLYECAMTGRVEEGYNCNGNVNAAEEAPHIHGGRLGGEASRPAEASSNNTASDDGAVFFTSADSLVPEAVSGKANVYEYREGNVYLISDGQDLRNVDLVGVDASGQNVFFSTHDRLLAQDADTQLDTYDARVNGGFAEPLPTPPCPGDACQGPLSGSPPLLSPGSELQAGGNPPRLPTKRSIKRRSLTRAQRFAQALRACRRRPKSRRRACERSARERFGAKKPKGRRPARAHRSAVRRSSVNTRRGRR